jgi:phosphate transport system permease protein
MRLPDAHGERVASAALWITASLVTGTLVWVIADVAREGASELSWSYLVDLPGDAGRAGGIASILVSTTAILAVCMLAAFPLGLGAAAFLSETSLGATRTGSVVRRSLDVLAAVPSIVFGLFGNAVFCKLFGLGFSILSGGLTLACMALPIVIRTAEQALRSVPLEQRLGAQALGLSRLTLLRTVVLPHAAPGIAAGMVLGIGRALAETAALIFTSGYVTRMPESLLDSGRALSLHVYDLSMNVPGGNARAAAAALVLVVLLLLTTSLTFWITSRWSTERSA